METLVVAHVPLVEKIARKVLRRLPPHMELDDLIGDGMVGLLDAARRYDAARGWRFATFAGHRIFGAILDGLRRQDPLARTHRAERRASGVDTLDEQLTAEHVARRGTWGVDMDQVIDHRQRRAWVEHWLAALPRREAFVVRARLAGETQAAIARRLGVTAGRVSQLERRAIVRLRGRWARLEQQRSHALCN